MNSQELFRKHGLRIENYKWPSRILLLEPKDGIFFGNLFAKKRRVLAKLNGAQKALANEFLPKLEK